MEEIRERTLDALTHEVERFKAMEDDLLRVIRAAAERIDQRVRNVLGEEAFAKGCLYDWDSPVFEEPNHVELQPSSPAGSELASAESSGQAIAGRPPA